ncbi:hypothetical protein ACF0H5_008376 [Mactra antiquata]
MLGHLFHIPSNKYHHEFEYEHNTNYKKGVQFSQGEKENGLSIPLTAPLKRTSQITGLSETTVRKILKRSPSRNPSPNTRMGRKKIILDEFDRGVVQRTVSNMYNWTNVLPTLDTIQKELQETIAYHGSKGHLRGVLKE